MDISLLQAFKAVAEKGSFSNAASELFITQPAISKRIKQLEEELGLSLFDRIGRNIYLTDSGQALLPKARQLILDANEIAASLKNLSNDVKGKLVMSTSHHIGLHRLSGPLEKFIETYPNVDLDIRFLDSEAACKAVEVGDIELAIATLPPSPSANLTMRNIWSDSLVFMISKKNKLANKSNVKFSELLKEPTVLPSSNTYTRRILEDEVKKNNLSLNIAMETNYLETLQMLAATGVGWSLLPKTLLNENVATVDVLNVDLSRKLGSVVHKRRTLSNAASAMLSICATYITKI